MKRLEDLDVAEVSLVGRPANKRRFLLLKSEEEGERSMEEILKAILETELPDEKKADEVLKAAKLDEKATNAVKGALRLLNAYKDSLPGDILKTLAELAGYGYPAPAEKAKDEGDKAPTEKAKGGGDAKGKEKYGYPAPVKKADGTWDLTNVPEELRPSLEAIFKEHEELVKKAAEAEQKAATTEAVLKAEREERTKKEFIAKAAADYPNLPGVKPEEFGLVLKGLSEKAPDEYKALEPVLKAANDQLGQSKLFAEVGSSKAIAGGSAWAKINSAADALVQKDTNLTREQAIRKVLDAHPELYEEHVKEMQGK